MIKGSFASHRMRKTTIRGGAILTVIFLLSPPLETSAGVSVWAAGSTEKIQDRNRSQLPHDAVWNAQSGTISIDGVRGERVAFHVVLTVENEDCRDVTLRASELRDGDNVLAAGRVRFFYEHLAKIYAPSGRHGKRGFWPDALVPMTQPLRINAAPLHYGLRKRNQPIWVELTVPRDQEPGRYRGAVTVSSAGKELGSVKIELKVWDITLPEERKYPVNIGLWENHIARVHGVKLDSSEFKHTFRRYLEFFLDQGFDPRTNPGLSGRLEKGKYVLKCQDPELEKLFLDRGRRRFFISPAPMGIPRPPRGKAFSSTYKAHVQEHCRQVIAHARKRGWYDRLIFHVPVDEPKSARDYQAARHWSEAIRPVDARVGLAVTEQPKPENPAWGSLVGHLNAWITHGNYVYLDPESILERKRAGDHVIWYISCDQLYPQPNVFIDREAADMRMISWLTARYKLGGFLYWTATYWREVRDPWMDAAGWKSSNCNSPASGEGSLIYPGHLVREYTGQDNVEGPVGSLRLALLRDGFEELELLQVLRDLGGAEEADKIVGSICRDLRDFSRDPNAIDKARDRVIQGILKRK